MHKTRLPIVLPLILAVMLVAAACGGWFENTKAGLLSANDALNAYDDIATEAWGEKAQEDSAEGQAAFDKLELSLCFSYLMQDTIVVGWGTAAMVDAGIKKESDFNFWAGQTLTLLDHFENVFDLWSGDNVPEYVKLGANALKGFLENFNPGGVMPPYTEPLEDLDCKKIVEDRLGQ